MNRELETRSTTMPSSLWPLMGIPLLIFAARMADVTLGTVRIILVARGFRKVAPLIGFVEILIWLVAIGQVISHLDRPLNYIAYAAGFATGTYVGMLLEERLALGLVSVRIITQEDAHELIEALKTSQFGVTSVGARGVRGRVRLIFTVVRRRDLEDLLEIVRSLRPKAFVSVSDVRSASEGYFPASGLVPFRALASPRKGK